MTLGFSCQPLVLAQDISTTLRVAMERLESAEFDATVPNENSVQPTSHAIPGDELQSRSSLRPRLSPANEVRRSSVQGSTVPDTDFKAPGEAARNLVDWGFSGSPSFVAVMQSTDLR
jgi:hypothetical protein